MFSSFPPRTYIPVYGINSQGYSQSEPISRKRPHEMGGDDAENYERLARRVKVLEEEVYLSRTQQKLKAFQQRRGFNPANDVINVDQSPLLDPVVPDSIVLEPEVAPSISYVIQDIPEGITTSEEFWNWFAVFSAQNSGVDFIQFKQLQSPVPYGQLCVILQHRPSFDFEKLNDVHTIYLEGEVDYHLNFFEKWMLLHFSPYFKVYWDEHFKEGISQTSKIQIELNIFTTLLTSLHNDQILEVMSEECLFLLNAADYLFLAPQKEKLIQKLLVSIASFSHNERNDWELAKDLYIFGMSRYFPVITEHLEGYFSRCVKQARNYEELRGVIECMKEAKVQALDLSHYVNPHGFIAHKGESISLVLQMIRDLPISTLNLSSSSVTNGDIRYLFGRNFNKLVMDNCPLTYEALRELGNGKIIELTIGNMKLLYNLNSLKDSKVQRLRFKNCELSKGATKSLGKLEELRALNLTDCQFKKVHLQAALVQLRLRTFSFTFNHPLKKGDLNCIGQMPLTKLKLDSTAVNFFGLTNEDYAFLRGMPLEDLSLVIGTNQSGECLACLQDKRIRKLTLKIHSSKLNDNDFAFLQTLPLEELSIHFYNASDLDGSFIRFLKIPSLKKLSLNRLKLNSPQFLNQLQDISLRELSLSLNPSGAPKIDLAFLKSMHSLQILYLEAFTFADPIENLNIIVSLPALERLRLYQVKGMTAQSFRILASKSWGELGFKFNLDLQGEALEIIEGMKIKVLDISYCVDVERGFLDKVKGMSLEELIVKGCNQFELEDLARLQEGGIKVTM